MQLVCSMNTSKNQQFFIILEKQRGAQNTIKKFIAGEKETTDQIHISECI